MKGDIYIRNVICRACKSVVNKIRDGKRVCLCNFTKHQCEPKSDGTVDCEY